MPVEPSGHEHHLCAPQPGHGGCDSPPIPAGPLTSGCGRWTGRSAGAPVFGVDALGVFELVFEDDDPACGLDRGALVDELTRAGRVRSW